MWPLPQWVHYAPVEALAITSSRVMLHVCCLEVTWRGFVWDWKTGDLVGCCGSNNHTLLTSPHQVLELPPTRGGVLVGGNTGVFFLDEFRVVVSIPNYPDVPEFTLFNTLIPCGSRRFRVSPRYHGWWLCAHVDGDRCLGTLDQHKPHHRPGPSGSRRGLGQQRRTTGFNHRADTNLDGTFVFNECGGLCALG